MTDGEDRVRGELWTFPPAAMPRVLKTIDQVEGANQSGEAELYERVVVTAFDDHDRPLGPAYTYLYATDPLQDGFRPIEATGNDVAWPLE
jgi:gamma-glutamylcyclotransferase (GGCT)/AIG2-like uncharacterized protein YtfP